MGLRSKIIAVVMAGVFFVGAASLQPSINFLREAAQLTFEPPLEGIPPILVFTTTSLGAFRGIIVDILWLRASKLKDEGKYYEHMQLSDWICKLEPRFPTVWAWRAWDMAYNISVDLPTGPERWKWVKAGIALLRDEGLKYNPSSAELYKELSWTFFHKIGQESDDHHWYYKQKLLKRMEELLGPGPDQDMEALRDAPDTISELLLDPGVRALADDLQTAAVKLNDAFCAALFGQETLPENITALTQLEVHSAAMKKLDAYLRAKRLRNEWKMDPAFMIALAEQWGPIDWRLPVAHSMYWAARGRQFAPEDSTIHYDRLVYYSIQDILRKGTIKLVTRGERTLYLTSPDYRFLEPMERAFTIYIEHYEGTPYGSTIRDAYNAFLEDSIWTAYFRGEIKKAASFFKKRYPKEPISRKLLHEYVEKEIRTRIRETTHHAVTRMLELLIARMWWSYASMDDDNAVYLQKQSERIYNVYKSERVESDNQERIALLDYSQLKNDVLKRIIDGDFPGLPFPRILVDNLEDRINLKKNREEADDAETRS